MNPKLRSKKIKTGERERDLFNGCEVIRDVCILLLFQGVWICSFIGTTAITHAWFLGTIQRPSPRNAAAIAAAAGASTTGGASSWDRAAAVALEKWEHATHNIFFTHRQKPPQMKETYL